MKFLLNNKIIKYFIIPFILLFLAFFLTSIFTPFTVLKYNHTHFEFTHLPSGSLYKEDFAEATFKANENYLGTISIRFNTFHKINNDTLLFQIKEQNAKNWFYANTYTVGQFQPDQLFTFGFATIPNSKGKIYTFRITSLHGKKNDAVAVEQTYPTFQALYQYPKKLLLVNKKQLVFFAFKKSLNFLTNIDLLSPVFPFNTPFLMYVFYLVLSAIKPQKSFSVIVLIGLLIIMDILFFSSIVDFNILNIIIGLWIVTVLYYKYDSSISFINSLFFLTVYIFVLLSNNKFYIAKTEFWIYSFFIIGLMQIIFMHFFKKKLQYKLVSSSLFKTIKIE